MVDHPGNSRKVVPEVSGHKDTSGDGKYADAHQATTAKLHNEVNDARRNPNGASWQEQFSAAAEFVKGLPGVTLVAQAGEQPIGRKESIGSTREKMLERGEPVSFVEKKSNGDHTERWVTARILINVSQQAAWKALHEQRKHDPDIISSEVLEQGENTYLLKQKFSKIPGIGSPTCKLRNVEVPGQRIDYVMTWSDGGFKDMKGSWALTPAPDGKSTYLEWSTYSNTGLPVPHSIVESFAKRKMERRLSSIKQFAQSETHAV